MSPDVAQLETHRRALTGHCYRMLGSAFDAEDAVQDTMVRAWRSLDGFDGRASLRTWLYRIATNVCLDALAARERRVRPMEEREPGSVDDPLEARPRTHWLEPIPDARSLPTDADPFELTVLRQSTRLAFVAALQHLSPRQRAALLLTDVVGLSAAEVAEYLDTSVAAVNSAIQRARATLARCEAGGSSDPPPLAEVGSRATARPRRSGARSHAAKAGEPLSEPQSRLLDRYVDAFHRYDVDGLVALMREDATLSMPPYTLWLRGPDAIRAWLLGRGIECRGSRLVPTNACGSPAFGQYRSGGPDGSHQPWALIVLELAGERIAAWNSFLDTENLFPLFGLPSLLAAAEL
jgi:RNA polymerase sigma-70 factor, ECF subfamily